MKSLIAWVISLCPPKLLTSIVTRLVSSRTTSLPPGEGLRLLFRIDSILYPLQGKLAVAYGGGVHTKHRHMDYHGFFISRISKGSKVLDIGCGDGSVAYDVAEKSQAYVLGVDQDEEKIRIAKARYKHKRIRYVVGDAFGQLNDDQFDVIILSNILEHLAERSRFLNQLKECSKAPRMLIRVPLFERDWRVPLKKELGVEWRLDNTHETEYTLESFAAEIAEAQMRIVHQEVRWGEIWAEVQ